MGGGGGVAAIRACVGSGVEGGRTGVAITGMVIAAPMVGRAAGAAVTEAGGAGRACMAAAAVAAA